MVKHLISGFLGALSGSAVLAGWLYFYSPEPYVVDVSAIINRERDKILGQVEDQKISQEEAGKELSGFLDELGLVLREYRRDGKLIVVKDAVLSGGEDITDEFARELGR
jgi:hypothetical protein